MLKAVAQAANDETLATDTVEAITAAAWLQLRAVTAAWFYKSLHIVFSGCFLYVALLQEGSLRL